jgi:RNA recognition motif-containing protein
LAPETERKEIEMSKKLFVGGLSWDTTDEGLMHAFNAHGNVLEAQVVTDRDTGRSRGFGFVTFANPSEADEAIRQMDGKSLDGRTINVNEARERAPRSGGGGGGGRGRDRY